MGQHAQAMGWFMRAEKVLRDEDPSTIVEELTTTKLALLQNLLRLPPDLFNEAEMSILRAMSYRLEASQIEEAPFLLTKLELCKFGVENSVEAFEKTLLRLMQITHLTSSTVDTIIYYVHQLKIRGPWSAFRTLKYFIEDRLPDAAKTEWVEKSLVTITWNHISPELMSDVDSLRKIFEQLNKKELKISSAAGEAWLMVSSVVIAEAVVLIVTIACFQSSRAS